MAKRPLRKRRAAAPAKGGGGGLLFDLLTLPVLGMPRMVAWIAAQVIEAAEQEELDEAKLQGQLLDLQLRYELEEIDEEEYARREEAILKHLSEIRQAGGKEQGP